MIRTARHTVILACSLLTSASSADVVEFSGPIGATQVVPASASTAVGNLTGTLDTDLRRFVLTWSVSGLLGKPTLHGAHVHAGHAGENGPVILDLHGEDGVWMPFGAVVLTDLSDAFLAALLDDALYLDFHTSSHPQGEVRGQVVRIPAPGWLGGVGCLLFRRRHR